MIHKPPNHSKSKKMGIMLSFPTARAAEVILWPENPQRRELVEQLLTDPEAVPCHNRLNVL
jgi:hypothetical protein